MKHGCAACHWHYFYSDKCVVLVTFGGECSEWMLAQRCATCRHFRVKGWCVERDGDMEFAGWLIVQEPSVLAAAALEVLEASNAHM